MTGQKRFKNMDRSFLSKARASVVWTPTADTELDDEKRKVYVLTVQVIGQPFNHQFTCHAGDMLGAVNKYLHHVRSADFQIGRVLQIEEYHLRNARVYRSYLQHVYPLR